MQQVEKYIFVDRTVTSFATGQLSNQSLITGRGATKWEKVDQSCVKIKTNKRFCG